MILYPFIAQALENKLTIKSGNLCQMQGRLAFESKILASNLKQLNLNKN